MANRSFVEISTTWDIVAARHLGRDEAKAIGFGTVDQARISTAVSELARCLYLYGVAGEVIIESITNKDKIGVCVTTSYCDNGVIKKGQTLDDGFSTSGELLVDLERVNRLMDEIEIRVDPANRTFLKVQKWIESTMQK